MKEPRKITCGMIHFYMATIALSDGCREKLLGVTEREG
jgi:hypothetical protein